MLKEFKYLFQAEPFFKDYYQNTLPESQEEMIKHFIEFIKEYKTIQTIVDNNYSQSMTNMEIFLGSKVGEIKQISPAEYWESHSYFQRLRLYYTHLLTAARHKYNIWLNDFIPAEYKEQPKKKSKKQLINHI